MNKIARSNRREDVRNFAREHGWQSRRGPNVHTLLPMNQRLLERVEAENAQLRGSVVDLKLEIQALRDVLGHTQSEIQGAVGLRAVNRDLSWPGPYMPSSMSCALTIQSPGSGEPSWCADGDAWPMDTVHVYTGRPRVSRSDHPSRPYKDQAARRQ